MKKRYLKLTTLLLIVLICSCSPNADKEKSIQFVSQKTATQSSTSNEEYGSPSENQLTNTPTYLNSPTLTPLESAKLIDQLLSGSDICKSPCLLGIIPNQTTKTEVEQLIRNYGFQQITIINPGIESLGFSFQKVNGLSISIYFDIQQNIVKNSTIYIDPEKKQYNVPRSWLSFSPETLIKKYGIPNKVMINEGTIDSNPSYSLMLFFDDPKIIIYYLSYDFEKGQTGSIKVCPLTDQMSHIRIWFGDNPTDLPTNIDLLETVSNLSIVDFSELMKGNSSNACFNINEVNNH